jgi:hypothetical protein
VEGFGLKVSPYLFNIFDGRHTVEHFFNNFLTSAWRLSSSSLLHLFSAGITLNRFPFTVTVTSFGSFESADFFAFAFALTCFFTAFFAFIFWASVKLLNPSRQNLSFILQSFCNKVP